MISRFLRGNCRDCPAHRGGTDQPGEKTDKTYTVALAGNPNTGKSTVFNALTGLRQHTGNWPGKTVTRAEGRFTHGDASYRLVDLPGTYSLLSASTDEEIARDFILFGEPDCTVVVVDATALERNLNLVFQVMEITDKVVVCVNLMDEAARTGIEVDIDRLSEDLGVPAVGTVANSRKGLDELVATVAAVTKGETVTAPRTPASPAAATAVVDDLVPRIRALYPGLCNARWIAYRLIEGDYRIRQALVSGELAALGQGPRGGAMSADRELETPVTPGRGRAAGAEQLLQHADALREEIGGERFRDELVATLFRGAERVASHTVRRNKQRAWLPGARIDRVLTHPLLGIPVMAVLFAAVFWITIVGANIPSAFLAGLLMAEGGLTGWFGAYLGTGAPPFLGTSLYEGLHMLFAALHAPAWFSGFLIDGVYLGLAWVVSVMLPPMAIFFPLFTLLEDLGYLPRVAFNLDGLFKRAGAHGKQALTMMMGFGCNAAGVIACRVIDSPRERLIAILTNVFVPCNGRFPTLIAVSTIFFGGMVAQASPFAASLIATGAVVGVVVIGVITTLIVSWALSRTLLRGEPSAFILELPPYRRPSVLRILYTSLIDRTLFVLMRAVVVAAPAGGIIWLMANVNIGALSVAAHVYGFLDPLGHLLGLDGILLLAFIIAIPANEIVMPTAIMLYLSRTRMIELEGAELGALLTDHGWTLLTAVCLMLFSLLHNPCGTTIWTIWRETRSRRWTLFGALMPLALAIVVCAIVATAVRLVIGGDL